MTQITITRFANGQRSYSRANSYVATVATDERMNAVITYIENCASQQRHHGGPSGLSFGRWIGSTNKDTDFREAHALAMDWRVEQFEELQRAAERLPFARVWFTGEDRAKTLNTITLVIPFSAPATKAEYERIASCIAKELDVCGLIDGSLAVNHITNVHANTMTAYERGRIMGPQAYIRDTAKLYQAKDAKKYQGTRPLSEQLHTVMVADDDGLFELPETLNAIQLMERCSAEISARRH
jgi:hypothetical protein